jgi:hypothetical protein
MLLIGTIDDLKKIAIWLKIKDCNLVINKEVYIAFGLLISSCLEPNSFHGLPYHIMSYFIIDLAI